MITNKINSPRKMRWNDLNELHTNGNEIGSHTHTHPYLTELSSTELDFELRASKALLSSFDCKTLAYPYGEYNLEVIEQAKRYYVVARGYCDMTKNAKDCGFNHFLSNERYKLKVFPTEHAFVPQYPALSSLSLLEFKEIVKGIIKNSTRSKGNNRVWVIFVFHGQPETNFETDSDSIVCTISDLKKKIFDSIPRSFPLSNIIQIKSKIVPNRHASVRARDMLLKFRWMCEYLTSDNSIEILTVSEVASRSYN